MSNLWVETSDPIAELLFWESVSPEALRYWPVFFYEREALQNRIERAAPLVCLISRRGITGASVGVDPLIPWISARWGEKDYFVSKEGVAWESEHELNEVLKGIKPPEGPPFDFSDEFPPPHGEDETIVAAKIVFPMDLLEGWIAGLAKNRWITQVERINISRREGRYLLSLSLKEGSRLLLRGELLQWDEIAPALAQVMEQLHFLGDNIIIDTTYTDRIIVRSMNSGDQEGSGK
ncbi:MAG: hypothetical protein GX181_01540 [Synergistaceae bacterium]|nr:hypothetical protein [Synergistaceae bacterium]